LTAYVAESSDVNLVTASLSKARNNTGPSSYYPDDRPLPELNFVVEPIDPGTTTFKAEGLTLGGRLERRIVYRFQGLKPR